MDSPRFFALASGRPAGSTHPLTTHDATGTLLDVHIDLQAAVEDEA